MPDIDKLISAIDWAEENAYGSDTDGTLSEQRALSIRYYRGENTSQAPVGRSQVVDRSIFETVEWMRPSFCRIFANGADLVSIPPIGPEDEEAAKQEAEVVNWVITQQNPWFKIFNTFLTDALVTRNAYILAYKDKRRSVDIEVYENQTEEGVALLLQDGDVEVIESNATEGEPEPLVDEMGQPVLDEMGQPVLQPTMLYTLKVRKVGTEDKYCLKTLPPERCKVSHYVDSESLVDSPYFEYWEYKTLSDLRAEGFDVPEDLSSESLDEAAEEEARDQYSENRDDDSPDKSMRRYKTRTIWIRQDYDEDGIAELRRVVRIGKTPHILYNEECAGIDVACGVPIPLPHRHMGMSIADITEEVQLVKQTVLRQGLDNLYISNNPQKVINHNLVNLDDVLTSVPGGIIRTEDVNAIRYELPPFVFPQAMEALEYMDTIRENRSGVSRYFTGTDQNALNKTASGINQLSTMAAQRVEQVARVLGSAIEDLARIVHRMLLQSGHKKLTVKLRGKWTQVDPSQWRERTDFKVAVGFAAGNKDAQVARLTMVSQNQLQALAMGIPIVQPQNLYETMVELTKASDFSSPERFWTDPAEVPPQPQANPEQDKLKAEMVAKEAELQLDQEKATVEAALKQQEMLQKGELERYRIEKDAETKLLLAQMQGSNAVTVERERAATQSQKQDRMKVENLDKLDKVVQQVEDIARASADQAKQVAESFENVAEVLAKALTAPKKIIRDKSGRAVGVESGA